MFSLRDAIQAPIKLSKVEGPTTSINFLGIRLNSITMEASISADRKQSLLEELGWMKQKDRVMTYFPLLESYHSAARYSRLGEFSCVEE